MENVNELELKILDKDVLGCADIIDFLGEYIDQNLSANVAARIESHIRSCPECRDFEETYRITVQLANSMPPAIMPKGVQNRLRQALNQRLGICLPMTERE